MDQRNLFMRLLLCAIGVLLVAVTPASAQAQTRVLRAVGVPEMGPNLHCGDPIWTLEYVTVPSEGTGSFVGLVHTPIFGNPAPTSQITQADCDGTTGRLGEQVLTSYDDQYGLTHGWTAPNSVLEARSFHQIPIPAGNDIRAPIPLPGSSPANPLPPTRYIPPDRATLASWLSVGGDLEITCDDATGTAVVAAGMYNLIPDALYTMWAHWVDATGEIVIAPFGNMPNIVVSDADGNAEYCRNLVYCPLDFAPDSSKIQFLSLMYMGEGVAYGAVPYEPFVTKAVLGVAPQPFLSTLPGGIVSFDHVGFRVNATGGPDPGPIGPSLCSDTQPTVATLPLGPLGLMGALAAIGALTIGRRVASS